ncbi:MAG: tetratricopeptide repeat protein [Sphingobacteriaceae bacterium]
MSLKKILLLVLLLILQQKFEAQDIDSLNHVINRSKDELARLKAYAVLSDVCQPNEIEKNARRALQLADNLIATRDRTEKEMLLKFKAKAVNNIGFAAQYKGDFEKARRYFISSGKIQESIKDLDGLSTSLGNIGFTYHMQGIIPKAIEYYNKALNIQEQINDKNGAAVSYANIADIYRTHNEIKKALEYYEKSLKIGQDLNLSKITSHALSALSGTHYQLGDTLNALKYINESIIIQEKTQDYQGLANSLSIKGNIYIEINDPINANHCFSRAFKLCKENNDAYGLAQANENLASLNFKLKNYVIARQYAFDALNIAEEIGVPNIVKSASELLSKISETTGNYADAFVYYKKYILYRDSISNEGTRKKALRNSLNAEFEKKEMAIKEQQAIERTKAEEKNRAQLMIIYISVFSLLVVAFFLVFLIKSLRENRKVNKLISHQNELLESKNIIIEEKQKELMDSINYAKRIQYTLLAHNEFLENNLPDHFIYFNPKDIVSGDFYWATLTENRFYLAVCDSTGHGVPGAFMSLLNIGFLTEAINEEGIQKPNEIFDYVRDRLIASISKEGQKDGFDGILICFDHQTKEITYAAANNEPVLIRNKNTIELKADRMPVGMDERMEKFKLYSIDAQKGDMLYLYTDGFADQFGGPKGKKFKYKQLNELLIANCDRSITEQHQIIQESFNKWKGDLEQIDDVCVIGIKI